MIKTIDVAAAIVEKEGKVLAARRKSGLHLAGFWEFPGGKVETGESVKACLARELQEEFNIKVRVLDYIGENIHRYDQKSIRLIAYRVEHVEGEFELIDHDKLLWLRPEEAMSIKWAPADIPLVKDYLRVAGTESFYSVNAKEYCEETSDLMLDGLYHEFESRMPAGARILDLGCGSGRDTLYFENKGFDVSPVDGNHEIAEECSNRIGKTVNIVKFDELEEKSSFEGVWCNASLLHCSRDQLILVLPKIIDALTENGWAFINFKQGPSEFVDDRGRFFSNFTPDELQIFLRSYGNLEINRVWATESLLRGKCQLWTNAIIRKDKVTHDGFPQ